MSRKRYEGGLFRLRTFIFASAILISAVPGHAQTTNEELLKSGESWNGGAVAYPKGDPLVSSYRITLEKGQQTPFHCHPVPTMGYLVNGTLEVETAEGRSMTLQQGQSMLEVMKTVHRGHAVGGPVEIIVFYAGAVGVPNTVVPNSDSDTGYCTLPE